MQAEPDLIKDFSGLEYYISTKMDGSSHSISIDEDGFHVTGHNFEYKNDGHCAFYRLVEDLGVEEKMKTYYQDHDLHLFLSRENSVLQEFRKTA